MEENNEQNIRTDLWNNMSTTQLARQRDLIVSKIALLTSIPSNPTTQSLVAALQLALTDVDRLIDSKGNR